MPHRGFKIAKATGVEFRADFEPWKGLEPY